MVQQLNLFRSSVDIQRYESLKPRFMDVAKLVNWQALRPDLELALPYTTNPLGHGRKPFDPVLMLKIMILQHFHDLNDDAMEFQLRDRQSFREFVGLHTNARIPDAKTIWLFRNNVAQAGAFESLFNNVLDQIEASGFIPQGGQIVDATLITTRKPTKVVSTDEHASLPAATQRQVDKDATFTKKNNTSYFGYKGHVNVDVQNKLVRRVVVTTASTHDSQVLPWDEKNTKKAFYGDSAYKSQATDDQLAKKAVVNRINRRAYRGKPLKGHDRRFNRTSSRVRCRIEHVFGQMKVWGRKVQLRSIGLPRATLGIGMKFLVYNLARWRLLQQRQQEAWQGC